MTFDIGDMFNSIIISSFLLWLKGVQTGVHLNK
jgi:hypothetical protein